MARRANPTVEVKAEVSIESLVDRGYILDREVKVREKELKAIKSKLLEVAETEKKTILNGTTHSAVISPNTSNVVNPLKFFDIMKLKKNLPGFFMCIKVGIEKAREYVNELDLESITTTETKEYGKISFK